MKGSESTELKIKSKELKELFPHLFGHIDFDDIFFLRIEKGGMSGDPPLRLIPNNKEPWNAILPNHYVLVVYSEFDFLHLDQQFQAVAHQLMKIPKGYKESVDVCLPEIIMFSDEKLVQDWLKKHKFSLS